MDEAAASRLSSTIQREYPARPIVGVGAVVFDGDRVLLVRRAKAPLEGEWSLPGGAVELGETLEEAIIREVAEETGLRVLPLQVVKAFDHIDRETDGRIRFHYVLIDFLCRIDSKFGKNAAQEGELLLDRRALQHASDVSDARWVRVEGLRKAEEFPLTERAMEVIGIAWRAFREFDPED
ncbi:MAG TPA: NUDIX hydrolase [Acidobacteriaceae bacterium]|nr:NUDIX hydrolase [Acidobacteriaceae bacterium]